MTQEFKLVFYCNGKTKNFDPNFTISFDLKVLQIAII